MLNTKEMRNTLRMDEAVSQSGVCEAWPGGLGFFFFFNVVTVLELTTQWV